MQNIERELRERALKEIIASRSVGEAEAETIFANCLLEAERHHAENPVRPNGPTKAHLATLEPASRAVCVALAKSNRERLESSHANAVAATFMAHKSGITKATADQLAAA